MQDIFEGGINFLQLKRALACRISSRAGRNRNTEYVAESVVDVQSFGAHCMTLYADGQLHSQKRPVGSTETEPTREWISTEQIELEIIGAQYECGW